MTRHKLVNGEKINLKPAEETARDQEEAQALIDQQAIKDAEQAAIDKKASGKQKLLDLGLSEKEVKALIGV